MACSTSPIATDTKSPALLAAGQRYRVRLQLNDAGLDLPAGHRIRLALSTAYWPTIWPSPEQATLTISAARSICRCLPQATDALISPLPDPESAPPEKPTIIRRGDVRIERIDRIGLELGREYKSEFHVEDDDPLSAVAEVRQTHTMSRDAWQIRVETRMRLSCSRDVFLLQEVCARGMARTKYVVANGIAHCSRFPLTSPTRRSSVRGASRWRC